MSMCPHTRRSGPMGLETALFCHDSPLRARCRTQIRLWGFQFDGGGYYGARKARRRSRANGIWEMSVKEKLIKIGTKVVKHGKYVTFQMAEVAVPRKLFREILRRIAWLKTKRRSLAPE